MSAQLEYFLSIIIVSWNVRNLLKNCLESIQDQVLTVPYEIIVVDNASKDGTPEMVKEEFPKVKLLVNLENKGFAYANNQGLKLSSGEIVLFLNPDTVVLSGTLERCAQFIQQRPAVGILGCKILNADGSIQYSCRSFPSVWNYFVETVFLHKLFPKYSAFGRFYGSSLDYNQPQETDVVLGAFLMTRKSLLNQLGWFDERFRIYSEETDLCYRIKKAGWKIFYYPEGAIIHFGGASTKQNSINMFLEDHKSRLLFMLKYFSWPSLLVSQLQIAAGVSLRVILWLLLSGWDFISGTSRTVSSYQKLRIFWNLFLWYVSFRNLKVAVKSAKNR